MRRSELILGVIILLLHVFVIPRLVSLVFSDAGISGMTYAKLNLICYLVSFILLLLCTGRYLKAMFSYTFSNIGRFFSSLLLGFLLYYALTILLNTMVLEHVQHVSNPNEVAINSVVSADKAPFIFLALVFAPIVEETLFRGVIFGFFRNKFRNAVFLSYIVSFILFAIYHLWSYMLSGLSVGLLINILQYLPASIALAYSYERSGSVCTSIILHCIINAVAMYFNIL